MKANRTRNIVRVAMFSSFLVICSWIRIPAAVPFTMQTFGIFITSVLLDTKHSTASVIVYIIMGLIGLPVFAGGQSGLSALFGQNGGFIIGFILCTVVCGTLLKRTNRSFVSMALSMLAGLICVYVLGSIWFWIVYVSDDTAGFIATVSSCVLPFIIPDLIKIVLATLVAGRLYKRINFNI
jgi:biotin transport system substrate-specific component